MSQEPTVGRVVHFHTNDESKQFNGMGAGPYAAVITQIHGAGGRISLTVFPPHETPFSASSVALKGQFGEEGQWWAWPPIVSTRQPLDDKKFG